MATPGHHAGNSAGPDTLITIKISVNDSLKKLKLPLKDLGAGVLIDKLRHCLNIKPEQHAIFERFSDSAGGYVVLESANTQVFKTLIRAAKAKSKLRLKATVTPDLTEKKVETTQDTSAIDAQKVMEPVIVRSPINQAPARDSTALDGRSIGSGIFQFREARASQQTLVEGEAPVPRAFTADRSDFFNDIARASIPAQRELAFRSREPAVIPMSPTPAQGQWSVYCNNCDDAMYDAHYHCSICDGGDYDLCETCIVNGTLCPGEGHWLIKRSIQDGKVVTSTTERIGRKAEKEIKQEVPVDNVMEAKTPYDAPPSIPTRTCNSCVYSSPESDFVHCTTCDDYDLCMHCCNAGKHGHHPAHAFEPATMQTMLSSKAKAALAPGRNVRHNAVCDGCDHTIFGVRHKCLVCPDWDYCSECVQQAPLKHARHRFAAIYEPIAEPQAVYTRHVGIYCDGPLCRNKADQSFISGVRYKCAVCNDTDFCASCEALPGNHHNRTHPLIKFKTPVRNVSITTENEDIRGHVRNMGDRPIKSQIPMVPAANAASEVKTVAEIKPEVKEEKASPIDVVRPAQKQLLPSPPSQAPSALLSAAFVKDSIHDGQIVAPGARFTQIWTLKNDGLYTWPAGCSVRYTGGDNMLNVDNGHPASVADIADATESNVVGREVAIGEEVAFKLVLKAPMREGKAISYWRVKAADGTPFGHRLWCDIEVKKTEQPQPAQSPPIEQPTLQHAFAQQRAQQLAQKQAQLQAQLQARMQASRQAHEEWAMQRQAVLQAQPNNEPLTWNSHPVAAPYNPVSPQPSSSNANQQADGNHQEVAKLRVEAIKAKVLKARAEAKAKAAADKKSAEENAKVKKIIEAVTQAPTEDAEATEEIATSQMVFPKLEKESPEASIIQSSSSSSKGKAAYVEDEEAEESVTTVPVPVQAAPSVTSPRTVAAGDDFDDFTDLEVLSADDMDSDDGFLTDEEYDILDASDNETVASK